MSREVVIEASNIKINILCDFFKHGTYECDVLTIFFMKMSIIMHSIILKMHSIYFNLIETYLNKLCLCLKPPKQKN